MKTSIIEIGLPTQKLTEVQAELEGCLREQGDTIIGYQVYDDLTLLVVRLADNTVQRYLDTLSAAFHKELISSFQVVHCHLFKVVFRQESTKMALREFPLRVGESWFAAVDNEAAAYICLDSPYLSQEQIAWLATQPAIIQWTQAS